MVHTAKNNKDLTAVSIHSSKITLHLRIIWLYSNVSHTLIVMFLFMWWSLYPSVEYDLLSWNYF
jgi:hypothetical protein